MPILQIDAQQWITLLYVRLCNYYNTNILFYNTLFDENASCHFAIGSAYRTCIKDGDDIKDDELDKYGVNNSLTHVDFMIGSSDMDIVGITYEGNEVQIFKDGNWAF